MILSPHPGALIKIKDEKKKNYNNANDIYIVTKFVRNGTVICRDKFEKTLSILIDDVEVIAFNVKYLEELDIALDKIKNNIEDRIRYAKDRSENVLIVSEKKYACSKLYKSIIENKETITEEDIDDMLDVYDISNANAHVIETIEEIYILNESLKFLPSAEIKKRYIPGEYDHIFHDLP